MTAGLQSVAPPSGNDGADLVFPPLIRIFAAKLQNKTKMMNLLQVDSLVKSTVEVTEELAKGDTTEFNELIKEGINWGIEIGKSLLLAVVIFVVGRFLISMANRLLANMLEKEKADPTIQSFLKSFVNITLTILLIICVVSALGVNTTSFAALLASAGVAVGMALSGNLQNLAGGLVILLFKPYKVGDLIEAQSVLGTVKEIQIFHTILVTFDNKVIYLPNGALSSGNIVNFSQNEIRRVDWIIGVEYGTDVDKARKVLLDLFAADERILKDPQTYVGVHELASSSVDLVARAWVKFENYWDVYYDLREKIYAEFNKVGIGFPFPQIQVHTSK